jgi:hypothetical protein
MAHAVREASEAMKDLRPLQAAKETWNARMGELMVTRPVIAAARRASAAKSAALHGAFISQLALLDPGSLLPSIQSSAKVAAEATRDAASKATRGALDAMRRADIGAKSLALFSSISAPGRILPGLHSLTQDAAEAATRHIQTVGRFAKASGRALAAQSAALHGALPEPGSILPAIQTFSQGTVATARDGLKNFRQISEAMRLGALRRFDATLSDLVDEGRDLEAVRAALKARTSLAQRGGLTPETDPLKLLTRKTSFQGEVGCKRLIDLRTIGYWGLETEYWNGVKILSTMNRDTLKNAIQEGRIDSLTVAQVDSMPHYQSHGPIDTQTLLESLQKNSGKRMVLKLKLSQIMHVTVK